MSIAVKPLSEMPYANAKVVITDHEIALVSYTTVVARIDKEGWLTINGLYSMTTRKHISKFVREYAYTDYSVAKKIYNDGYKYNIYTGEVTEILR